MKRNSRQNSKRASSNNAYIKYSGLAFQMLAVILVGVFGGMQLDKFLNIQFPLFTLLLSVGGLIGSMYLLFKDLMKK